MTTTTTLFGLALAPLYYAIATVETDRGATSANIYQLKEIYVRDVNRIIGCEMYNVRSPYIFLNPYVEETMMQFYWRHWGIHYQKKTGKPVSYEVLARIHNGGPLGWKKPETVAYWNRVKAVLESASEEQILVYFRRSK